MANIDYIQDEGHCSKVIAKVTSKTKLFLTYLPLVKSFNADIQSVNFKQIEELINRFDADKAQKVDTSLPQPHIPIVGDTYDSACMKIAIYGMETRQWGDLVKVVRSDIKELIINKDCDNWINNLEYWNDRRTNTFHAFIKRLLLSLYDYSHDQETIAKSIVYGQYDSYVRWEKIPFVENNLITGNDRDGMKTHYNELKRASTIFDGDSFRKITCLNPDVIIMLSWRPKISFSGYEVIKENNDIKLFRSIAGYHKYIIMVPHPVRMKYLHKSYDDYIGIIKSELLNIYHQDDFKFKPMPERVDKHVFIGELANYLSTLDIQFKISHSDIQACLKYNGYKAGNGTEYGNNGVGIRSLLKSSCQYYHNKGDHNTESNILRFLI